MSCRKLLKSADIPGKKCWFIAENVDDICLFLCRFFSRVVKIKIYRNLLKKENFFATRFFEKFGFSDLKIPGLTRSDSSYT